MNNGTDRKRKCVFKTEFLVGMLRCYAGVINARSVGLLLLVFLSLLSHGYKFRKEVFSEATLCLLLAGGVGL